MRELGLYAYIVTIRRYTLVKWSASKSLDDLGFFFLSLSLLMDSFSAR